MKVCANISSPNVKLTLVAIMSRPNIKDSVVQKSSKMFRGNIQGLAVVKCPDQMPRELPNSPGSKCPVPVSRVMCS